MQRFAYARLAPSKPPSWLHDFVSVAVYDSGTSEVSYSLSNCLSYKHLPPHYQSYIIILTTTSDPLSFAQAIQDAKWCSTITIELRTLEINGAWKLTSLQASKTTIGANGYMKPC